MLKTRRMAVVILMVLLMLGSSRAANAQRAVTGAFGVASGTLSGGYITLSIVVARAQMGHYLHSMSDIMSWNALPVLIGGSVGGALGVWDPDRLMTGAVYGSAGAVVGGATGFVVGRVVSKRPEAQWAGGAIGAGLGMAIGSSWGVFFPNPKMNFFDRGSSRTVVPVTIRIPL
jgi:hypothetical protein